MIIEVIIIELGITVPSSKGTNKASKNEGNKNPRGQVCLAHGI